MDCSEVIAWIEEHKSKSKFSCKEISFQDSKEWKFLPEQEALVHKSERFFEVRGYRATSSDGTSFNQPLINQWEIGIQAFLIKGQGDSLQVLMQAKTEPGNIGITQVSPTLQVTRSNLQGVHKGTIPQFAELFIDLTDKDVLVNEKYPELGNRYYKKYNENIIISTQDEIEDDLNFKWIPIQTLKELLRHDNIINNDARLVLSLLFLKYGDTFLGQSNPFQQALLASWKAHSGSFFEETTEAQVWLDLIRKKYPLTVEEIPLTELEGWEITDKRILRKKRTTQYSIMQISVESDEREVSAWDQPIINANQQGLIGFICQEFDGVLHVLFEAAAQIGGHLGAELLPSVCYDGAELNDTQFELYKLMVESENLIGECVYSEEGGRFFQDDSWMGIVLVDDLNIVLPENYCWLTLGQIRELSDDPHFFSDEARGALAVLLSYM
jgi:oxidase EvaA